MTITTITDKEIKLQALVAELEKELTQQKRIAQDNWDWYEALKADHANLSLQIEASRKQEPVMTIGEDESSKCRELAFGTKLYAAPVVAPDVLTHKYELELPQDDSRTLKVFWTERVIDGQTMAHKLCIAVSLEEGHGITGGQQ
jgi:hypothetical protein